MSSDRGGDWANDRDRVRSANPIEEVIQDHFPLLPEGRNLKALCPFHAEKTPSFKVDPDRGSFHCFGCGARGDVFSFVQQIENIDFRAALELLAQRAGVSLTGAGRPAPGAGGSGREGSDRRTQLELLKRAHLWFQKGLLSRGGAEARKYLADRGFTEETVRRFAVGFAPPGWSHLVDHLRLAGASMAGAARLGLVRERQKGGYHDVFRSRIIFPIRRLDGAIIGFGGRRFGGTVEDASRFDEPKYLNSPESALFRKGQLLYGLHEGREDIRRDRTLLLMEGYTDVMMAHQAGFTRAVATLGTAVTEANVGQISRHADAVQLVFDGDLSGRKAALKAVSLFLSRPVRVNVALLDADCDPCDLLRREGGSPRFADYLAGGWGPIEFVIRELVREIGIETGEQKDRVARETFPYLRRMNSEIRRWEGIQLLAQSLRIPHRNVGDDFVRWLKSARRHEPGTRRRAAPIPGETFAGAESRRELAGNKGLGGSRSAGSQDLGSPHGAIPQDGDVVLLACLARSEWAAVFLALTPPGEFGNPIHGAIAQAILNGRGEVDIPAFEDPHVKSKVLELKERLEAREFEPERATQLLRDILVKKLEVVARELHARREKEGGGGPEDESTFVVRDLIRIRADLALLRGRRSGDHAREVDPPREEWNLLLELARKWLPSTLEFAAGGCGTGSPG